MRSSPIEGGRGREEGAMGTRRLSFSDFLDARPLGSTQNSVIAACVAVALLNGFSTQTIAPLAPGIAREWGLTVAALGPIVGAGLVSLTLVVGRPACNGGGPL